MKFRETLLLFLFSALALIAVRNSIGAAGDKAYVFLHGEAKVTSAQLRLGEVAQVSGMDDELNAALDNLPLGPAPLPGESLILSRMDIRRSLAGHGIDPLRVALAGPDSVTVMRSGWLVTHEKLKELVEAYIGSCWANEEVRTEIIYTRLPDEIALEAENCTLKVLDPVKPGLSGALAVSVAAMDGDRGVARFPVSVRVRLWRNVVVMKNSLDQDAVISADDITVDERELTGKRSEFITAVDDAIGMRVKRSVKADQALTAASVESPPLVERGDEVMLIVKYKEITIGCLGKAWQKGGKGDRILVRNQYGKNLVGEVQDSHTVLINP